jgi:hypothetical protein
VLFWPILKFRIAAAYFLGGEIKIIKEGLPDFGPERLGSPVLFSRLNWLLVLLKGLLGFLLRGFIIWFQVLIHYLLFV